MTNTRIKKRNYKIEVYASFFSRTPDVVFNVACENDEEAYDFAEEMREQYHAIFATAELA